MKRTFSVTLESDNLLDVDDVWPDGDAPENPTSEDVIKAIKEVGSVRSLVLDWGFTIDVLVDGKKVDGLK
jgi:hypothetical protein